MSHEMCIGISNISQNLPAFNKIINETIYYERMKIIIHLHFFLFKTEKITQIPNVKKSVLTSCSLFD